MSLKPFNATRLLAAVSSRADAPGAQDFRPPSDEGIWLPPQRTFSSADPAAPLRAERANQAAVTIERDVAGATLAIRGFRQRVNDQLATWFDTAIPGEPSGSVGHYVLANVGTIYATGWTASVRRSALRHLAGSLEYSSARVRLAGDASRPSWTAAEAGGSATGDGDRVPFATLVKFKPDVRTFLKRWVAEGPTHHFALGIGHHAGTIAKIADVLDLEAVIV